MSNETDTSKEKIKVTDSHVGRIIKESSVKTVLDEDADIYRARETKSASETFKSLKGKAKARYFVDYYLVKILIVVAILAVLANIVYTALKPKPVSVYYVAIVVSPFLPEAQEQFKKDLTELLTTDTDKEEITFDTDYSSLIADYNSGMAYTMHMAVGEIDMIIMTKEELKYQVNNEVIAPIDEVISKELYDKIPDDAKHKVLPTYLQENGDFIEGEERVYALNISSFLERINGFETSDKYCVAFIETSSNKDKIETIVKYMFGIS